MAFRKTVATCMSIMLVGALALTGCGNKDSTQTQDDLMYSAKFDVDTGEIVQVSVDEDSGFAMLQGTDGFSVVSQDEDTDTEDGSGEFEESVSVDITGVFLTDVVANNTQAKFHGTEYYDTVSVDGKDGYAFTGVNDDDILTYVYVIPCGDKNLTYLELFSTVSEKELATIVPSIHVQVLEQ